MTVNNFDVLKELCKRSNNVHAYPKDNITNINAGKKGWGSITIAISTGDAQKLLNETMAKTHDVGFYLIVWDIAEFDKLKAEMEEVEK